uniref:Uncharacterized protein n=1 Tax=Romanomermis culicivorax TaxID=13658 RepID=A0A915JPT7_ROMCU
MPSSLNASPIWAEETEQEQLEEQRSRLDDHNRLLIDPDDDEDGPGDEEILTQSQAICILLSLSNYNFKQEAENFFSI